jgi:hypothetical protein
MHLRYATIDRVQVYFGSGEGLPAADWSLFAERVAWLFGFLAYWI